jgi:thiosulfate dehydrogenase
VETTKEESMIKWFIAGIVAAILFASAASYIVLRSGVIPANADANPGTLERFVAETSLRATLQNEAPKQPNPIPLTDTNLIAGIQLYRKHCAICHGVADAAPSPIAQGEYPAPPQLAKDGVEDDPQGWTFWKIKHGIRWTGMPSWKGKLNDHEIWTLALLLKHLNALPPAAEADWRALGNSAR